LFLIRNSPSSRRKLSQKQSFNARVEKGDKVAVAMNEIFKAGKWAVHGSSRSPMRITSIPLAEDCYNLDKGRSFTLALVDIDNAWPNRTSPVNLLMITAVAYLHYNGAKIGVKPDQKRLRLALGFNLKAHKRNGQYPALTPADYVDLVRGTLKVHAVPNARYMPRHLGDEILDRYNHGLAREHKLGDRYLDGLPSSLDTD